MIRRAVASGLGRLVKKMKVESFIQEMIPILKTLIEDDQDSVRVLCMESLVEISRSFSKELNKATTIPLLIMMAADKAWKVRIKFANSFAKFAEAMGPAITEVSLVSIFAALLSDPEGEVRLAGTQNFTAFLKLTPKVKYQSLLPIVNELLRDTLFLVRVSAFEILCVLIMGLSKEEITSKIIPTILSLIRNESVNEVKIEQVKALAACGAYLGIEVFTVLPTADIQSIFKEKCWRVRKEAYSMVADMCALTKSSQLFEVHFQEAFFGFLTDRAYRIRLHGCTLLPVD